MQFNTLRVCNWKNYNNALIKRGTLILNFTNTLLSKLYYTGKQKREGIRKYNIKMYEYLPTLKAMLRLPKHLEQSII